MEYVVAAPRVEAYKAVTAAVSDAGFSVVRRDARHLTLAFRPGAEWGDNPTVLVAVLDVGHGMCKLVLVGRAGCHGAAVRLTDAPRSLFASAERRLQRGVDSSAARASARPTPTRRTGVAAAEPGVPVQSGNPDRRAGSGSTSLSAEP